MIRRVVQWFRLVAPPPGWIASALVVIVLLECGISLLARMLMAVPIGLEGLPFETQQRWLQEWEEHLVPFYKLRFQLAAGLALIYGVYRSLGFHPLARKEYFKWLQTTPWRPGLPLPLGPVHLVLQDACVVAALCGYLLLRPVPWSLWLVPVALLFGYLATLCVVLWKTGQWWVTAVLAFGLGVVVFPLKPVAVTVFAAVCLYGVALVGLRASLRAYPWENWKAEQERRARERSAKQLGWPYARLMAPTMIPRLSYRDGFLASVLLAWWTVVLLELYVLAYGTASAAPGLIFALWVLPMGALGRLVIYGSGHHPPISLAGRIRTGQWIIPGFDKVFFAPLLAVVAPFVCAAPYLLTIGPTVGALRVALPLMVLVGSSILLNAGPQLDEWRLTGHHRVVPDLANARNSSSGEREFQKL